MPSPAIELRREPEKRVIRLSSTQPLPEQAIYDSCSAAEDRQLAEDIRRRGLDRLIEVLPPVSRFGKDIFFILDGNRRKEALISLGFLETMVFIRWDLDHATDAQKLAAFVSANLMRRQLDMIQRVRAAVRKYELEHANGRQLSGYQLQKAREQIGTLIGVSGRTISRYLRLSRAPLFVQQAVSRGLLPLTVGEKVAILDSNFCDQLVEELRAATNENFLSITARYLEMNSPATARPRRSRTQQLLKWVTALSHQIDDIENCAEEFHGPTLLPHLPVLQRASITIGKLIVGSKKPGADLAATLGECFKISPTNSDATLNEGKGHLVRRRRQS